jgi:hypothetical protein
MHAVIRRYTAKGTADKSTFDEMKRRLEAGFIPRLQEVPGFHCYYVVNAGNKELVTVGVFENKTGADESTRRAAEFLKNESLREQFGSPEVLEGELLLAKEPAVATR